MVISVDQLKHLFPRLLARFGAAELAILLDALTRLEAGPGDVLYRCGQHADSLYLVWQGKLAVSLTIAGEELFLGHLGPGQFTGITAVIDPGPALVSATVVESSVLLRLTHAGLASLRENQPPLGNHLLRALSLELVEWLRGYEAYMKERARPDSIQELLRMSGYLLGTVEAEQPR